MMPLAMILGVLALAAIVGGATLGARKSTNSNKARSLRNLREADAANINVGHALSLAIVVAVVIVGAVVALQVLASLFPTYSGAVKNLSSNMTTADWGNTTANSLGPIFGLLISLAGIFAILGLAFLAFAFYKGSKSGGGLA